MPESIPGIIATIAASIFGILCCFFAFVVICGMVEKRFIKPYRPNEDPEYPATSKSNQFCTALENDDFEFIETVKDSRGGIYRLRYDFYRSPDGDRLALVSCGTLMKIPFDCVRITTRFEDGTSIKTITHQNGSELDLTGMVKEKCIENASPGKVLDLHDARIEFEHKKVMPFDDEQPVIDFCGYLLDRVIKLEEMGYARFVNEERSVWVHTFRGAVILAFRMILIAVRRNFKKD